VLVCVLVFDLPQRGSSVSPVLYYAPAALFVGRRAFSGVVTALRERALALTVSIILGACHGLGPFVGEEARHALEKMQLFLIAAAGDGVLLAGLRRSRGLRRRRESLEPSKQLTLSRVAVRRHLCGGIGMKLTSRSPRF